MAQLDGKAAIVTAGGAGIGQAISWLLAQRGAQVLAADISGREEETAAELGDAVRAFRVDVTKEDEVEAMFAAAVEAFGRVDTVLNVAGIGGAQPVHKITMDEYDRIMDVDLRGVLLGTKHGIRTMLPTGGGSIVNWSSIGGINASDMPTSVYSAAKAGVISFTKAAAVEYGTKGIRANAICPGLILTELSGGQAAIDAFPQLVEGAAMKRAGQPEEVAELASFLASDRSSFITGAVIPIDGGNTCALR